MSKVSEEVWDLLEVNTNCECRMDGCKKKSVAIWAADPKDLWPVCHDCQELEFGGWPEGVEPLQENLESDLACLQSPSPSLMTQDNLTGVPNVTPELKDVEEELKIEETGDPYGTTSTDLLLALGDSNDPTIIDGTTEEDNKEGEETWEIVKITSAEELKNGPVKCGHDTCMLPAATLWASSSGEKWYSCLDCQEQDFGGWPPENELPVNHLDPDHSKLLVQNCSRKSSASMPKFQSNSASQKPTKTASKVALEAQRAKWMAEAVKLGGPGALIIIEKDQAKTLIFDTLHDSFKPMTITQIYQALKGSVPSPILKACLDEMLPAQSNPFDSEEESEEKVSKKTGSLHFESLLMKATRSANACLYYVNHNKLKNNGNGLDPHDRNEQVSQLVNAEAELQLLCSKGTAMKQETEKLLGEPTNEELLLALQDEECVVKDLEAKLLVAQEYKSNEKKKHQIKKRIEQMASVWRQRRRKCLDFLVAMEENTDGAVRASKCLAGDGQIEIDSDDVVAASAIEFEKKKRTLPFKKKAKTSKSNTTAVPKGDPNLVGVRLDSQGLVERVYLPPDE